MFSPEEERHYKEIQRIGQKILKHRETLAELKAELDNGMDCCYYEQYTMCCCKCEYQMIIRNHPRNRDVGQGPLNTIMGHGCRILGLIDNDGSIVFNQYPHGMCEMFKEKIKNETKDIIQTKSEDDTREIGGTSSTRWHWFGCDRP